MTTTTSRTTTATAPAEDPVTLRWRACWESPLHVAVVHGPDAGWAAPLLPDRDLVVGRGRRADLRVADPELRREHVRFAISRGGGAVVRPVADADVRVLRSRARRHRRAGRPGTAGSIGAGSIGVGSVGAGNGAGWRRARHVCRPTRLRVGERLSLGGSTLELRRPPLLAPQPPRSEHRRRGTGGSEPGSRRRVLTLLPLAAVLVVAGVMVARGAPAYLAIGLLLTAVTTSVSLLSGRSREEPPETADGVDPARVAVLVAGLGAEAALRLAVRPEERADPGPAGQGSSVTIDEGAPQGRPVHVGPEGILVAPGGGTRQLGIAGAVATARWTATQVMLAGRSGNGPEDLDGRQAAVLVWPESGLPPPTPAALLTAEQRAGVSAGWFAAIGHLLGGGACPGDLRTVLGSPGTAEVVAAWERASQDLAVPLGPEPEAMLDLLGDGPHALVAGTTGSGKSELLQAWVLALASRHAPRDVSFLLVDYKGGATFTHAARLPHCVGLLTDLDPAGSRRAVSALRHELRRRERLLQEAGARDRADYLAAGGQLGRLVVVVDELRALVEDDEERLSDLVAVATLGRSLGVHLILATQRPGGVVTGQLRANLTLRICLRVLESGDALDAVGSARPAAFTHPGEAMLGSRAECRLSWLPGEAARELTDVIVAAGERARRRRRADLLVTGRPWLPALPEAPPAGAGAGPLLVDRPEIPAHQVWRPGPGHLLVTGPPRSGRSTALEAFVLESLGGGAGPGEDAASADDAGVSGAATPRQAGCHVLSREGWGEASLGTVAGCGEPEVQARLLAHLAAGGDPAATVVIDDVEQIVAAVDQVAGPGAGLDLVGALLSQRRSGRVLLGSGTVHRWAPATAHHLALGVRDAATASALGVSRRLIEPRPIPGRGVLLSGGHQVAAQVVPAPRRPATPSVEHDRAVQTGDLVPPDVLRLRPLPERVAMSELDVVAVHPSGPRNGQRALGVPIGLGHEGVVELEIPDRGGVLVVGPPGSGRTNVLRIIARWCERSGLAVQRAAPGEVPALVGNAHGAAPVGVVLVDEAEALTTEETERLRAALRGRCVVVATPAALTNDFRGLVAGVRDAGRVLALGGFTPGRVRPPVRPGPPGRGLLVVGGQVEPVQVAHHSARPP